MKNYHFHPRLWCKHAALKPFTECTQGHEKYPQIYINLFKLGEFQQSTPLSV